MIAITAIDLAGKVHQDYESNFMPGKEINLRLTFEEMKGFLKNETLQEQIQLTWHFKFYVKQLFWLSWNQIDQMIDFTRGQKKEMIDALKQIVMYDHLPVTRALVCFIELSFFLESISTFHLQDIFWGHSIYDDHCAQLAYYEYNKRGKQ
jgi:hypothetical protein